MAATLLTLSKATIAKVALPAVAVAAAAGYAVAAPSAPVTGPGVWLDSPLMGTTLQVGMVKVQGHASASSPVASMTLLVDGAEASSTTALEQRGNLSYATLPWQATAGTHQLQIKAGALTSMVVVVEVGDHLPATLPTTAGPSTEAPTTAPTSAPAGTPPAATTTAPPTVRPTTRPTTTRPVPTVTIPPPPPPSTSVAPAPTILRTLVSQPLDNYPGCGGTTQVTVTAEISGASSATFVWQAGSVRGTGTMSIVSGTTWRGTSPQDLWAIGLKVCLVEGCFGRSARVFVSQSFRWGYDCGRWWTSGHVCSMRGPVEAQRYDRCRSDPVALHSLRGFGDQVPSGPGPSGRVQRVPRVAAGPAQPGRRQWRVSAVVPAQERLVLERRT